MGKQEGYITYRISDFEGSGNGSGYYDERKEKMERKQSARVLSLVLIGILFCLGLTTYLVVRELNYKYDGTKQTVECNPSNATVSWRAPDDRTYIVDIAYAFSDEHEIDIYYLGDDYGHAIVMTNYKLWCICYLVFGGLFVVVLYSIIKTIRPKKHANV
ncbi:MAG: hypothetical protein Q4F11_06365 [Eubacteriales bacterium]|nr:hypothetical protein [Eubacteriales bacterium]